MFKCEECGRTFAALDENYEHDTGLRTGTCPYCGCDSIIEPNTCVLCGELTANDVDDFCAECMNEFEDCIENVIWAKVSAPPEDVLASYFEGYPQRDGCCTYCNGGNCDVCEKMTDAVIATACDMLGCTKAEVERMASQKYGW